MIAWSKVFRLPRWPVQCYVLGQTEAALLHFLSEALNTREMMFMLWCCSFSSKNHIATNLQFAPGSDSKLEIMVLVTFIYWAPTVCICNNTKMYTNDKLQCSQWCRHIFIYILSEGEVRQGDWIIWQRKQGWEVWSWEWDSVLFHFRVWLSDHVVSCKKDQVKIMFLFSLSWLSSDSLTVG